MIDQPGLSQGRQVAAPQKEIPGKGMFLRFTTSDSTTIDLVSGLDSVYLDVHHYPPFRTAVITSAASFVTAQFALQTDGKYLVKAKEGAVFEFLASDFKSAMAQLVMEITLLKKAGSLPENFNIATQVKIDMGT